MWGKRLGRREKLAQKVGRGEIYSPVPPPSLQGCCVISLIVYFKSPFFVVKRKFRAT